MSNRVVFTPQYYPLPNIGRAVPSGSKIFIGKPDLDPTVVDNQKQVSVLQEDTTLVEVAQPIETGAGGVPLHNGSPVTIFVDGDYSVRVDDPTDVQIYFIPRTTAESILTETVDSLFDLLTITGQTDFDSVVTLSFFSTAVSGGGRFVWQSSVDKTTANGGTIIDPDNIGGFDGTVSTRNAFLAAQGGGVGLGCWVRTDSQLSVAIFGAVAEGFNDTEAFLKAVSAAVNFELIFIQTGDYYITSSGGGEFVTGGAVRFLNQDTDGSAPKLSLNLDSVKGDSRFSKNPFDGRDELLIYTNRQAFSTGSTGSGIHLYGNHDSKHAGNVALLTGQDDEGDARVIISGGSKQFSVTSITRAGSTATVTTDDPHELVDGDNISIFGANETEYNVFVDPVVAIPTSTTFTYAVTGTPATPATGTIIMAPGDGARLNTDTRMTIGNIIFDFVDNGDDTAMLNLRNPIGRPAICFTGVNSLTEGELTTPDGEGFALGHWDGATEVFTRRFGFSGSGDFEAYSNLIKLFDDRSGATTDFVTMFSEKKDGRSIQGLRSEGGFLANGAGIDLYGESDSSAAGQVVLFSSDLVGGNDSVIIGTSGDHYPGLPNNQSSGLAGNSWSVIFSDTGTIQPSDEKLKQDIEELDEAEIRVAVKLKGLPRKFRYVQSVIDKGDDARLHIGVIAQEVKYAFESEGLDGFRYGVLCYDEWDEQPEVKNSNGEITQPYREAGNRYAIRYEELIMFIIAAL